MRLLLHPDGLRRTRACSKLRESAAPRWACARKWPIACCGANPKRTTASPVWCLKSTKSDPSIPTEMPRGAVPDFRCRQRGHSAAIAAGLRHSRRGARPPVRGRVRSARAARVDGRVLQAARAHLRRFRGLPRAVPGPAACTRSCWTARRALNEVAAARGNRRIRWYSETKPPGLPARFAPARARAC